VRKLLVAIEEEMHYIKVSMPLENYVEFEWVNDVDSIEMPEEEMMLIMLMLKDAQKLHELKTWLKSILDANTTKQQHNI
jgi:hypothetical protein